MRLADLACTRCIRESTTSLDEVAPKSGPELGPRFGAFEQRRFVGSLHRCRFSLV
jgi:hypothetical protein